MTDFLRYSESSKTAECPEHGRFDDHAIHQFTGQSQWLGCPRCRFDALHSGIVATSTAAQQAQHARELNEALLDAGIPPRFRGCTLDQWVSNPRHPDQATALSQCQAFLSNFQEVFDAGRCMMLLGTVGTGKTHLAAAVLQQAVTLHHRHGFTGRYETASTIIRAVKSTFGNRDRDEATVYADLISPTLLVIDEVGVQHGTDFERMVLFEVINGRYEQMLPTIVVSNMGIPELRKCIGDRAVDRLSDKAGIVVVLRWPSVRGAS